MSATGREKCIFLHVGCGEKRKDRTLRPFAGDDWREVTLDINPACRPDIVDSLPDLAQAPDDWFDEVYSSHNIEHLFGHEVVPALRAFRRVLKPEGVALITCPDLQCLEERLATGDVDTPLYVSPAGPIAPLDILYGHRRSIAAGNHFMAHRGGFTVKSLSTSCADAGFESVMGFRRKAHLDLFVIAAKTHMPKDALEVLARHFFAGIVPFAAAAVPAEA